MLVAAVIADDHPMWTVTTKGDLPDDYEQREYDASMGAWDDYAGRILELEIDGYTRVGAEATRYGRRWACSLSRGVEQMNVVIERIGMTNVASVGSEPAFPQRVEDVAPRAWRPCRDRPTR